MVEIATMGITLRYEYVAGTAIDSFFAPSKPFRVLRKASKFVPSAAVPAGIPGIPVS
jgi:hypothetical protein